MPMTKAERKADKARAKADAARRMADAMATEHAQCVHDIATIQRVDVLLARVRASVVSEVKDIAVVYTPSPKPIPYGVWKRYADTLPKGYALKDTVKATCIHCEIETELSETYTIVVGAIVKYNTEEVVMNTATYDWDIEEKKVIRPATVKGIGCRGCYWQYTKAVSIALSHRTRVVYQIGRDKFSLYAKDNRDAANQLAERFGNVELVSCKTVAPRTGFLDVSSKASAMFPPLKQRE